MALWTKKKITGIVPAELEKVPLFVLLILQFNICYLQDGRALLKFNKMVQSMKKYFCLNAINIDVNPIAVRCILNQLNFHEH